MADTSSLRAAAEALDCTVTAPYRTGIGWELGRLRVYLAGRNWRGVRRTAFNIIRRMRYRTDWALWQCEGESGLNVRRGWTARQAEQRMLTDEIRHALRLAEQEAEADHE